MAARGQATVPRSLQSVAYGPSELVPLLSVLWLLPLAADRVWPSPARQLRSFLSPTRKWQPPLEP
jgi:hypothetical protein